MARSSTLLLSPEQRHLMRFVGSEAMLDALLGEDGVKRLIARCGGASGFTAPMGAPEWMTSYDTVGGKIVSPASRNSTPRVVVTAAQIQRYGAGLPSQVRSEMRECLHAQRAEYSRTADWCHCGYQSRPRNAHAGPCPRLHPSDAQDTEHYHLLNRLHQWVDALLDRVLDLSVGQLALFDELP